MSKNAYERLNLDELESDGGAVAASRPTGCATLYFKLIALAILIFSRFLCERRPVPRNSISSIKRSICASNLSMIALALELYYHKHGCFPPAYTVDANGRPLHSWRTLILPYLGHEDLYQQIDLSKPWDHTDNRKAFETGVGVYRCLSVQDASPGHTTYLAIVSDKSCLQPAKPRKLSEIGDAPNLTIVVIEVDARNAVPWMSPRDANEQLVLEMLARNSTQHRGIFHVLLADGTVKGISNDIDRRTLHALLTATGHDDDVIHPGSF